MSICVRIKDGFISYANTKFYCPYCERDYDDYGSKYLDRCNKNKSGYTTITCSTCSERFGMTYHIQGDAVGFKL